MKKALREPFNIKTFVEFLRHATGQPRPRCLKAFNDAVALDEASGSVHVLAVSRIAARVAKTEDDYQGGNAEWYSYGIAP